MASLRVLEWDRCALDGDLALWKCRHRVMNWEFFFCNPLSPVQTGVPLQSEGNALILYVYFYIYTYFYIFLIYIYILYIFIYTHTLSLYSLSLYKIYRKI